MNRTMNRDRYLNIILHITMIFSLLYFFIERCPLIVFDIDDWIGLTNFRLPIPIWGGWNPSRVLPETLMPIAGRLAARVIYPFCKDYIYSVTIISAIIITLLIIMMCVCMQKVLTVRCHLTIKQAITCEMLFIILFFLIFRNRGTSACMFTAADLCCIYNYTISGIFNAIVVLVLLKYDDISGKFLQWNLVQKVLFLLLLYFAVFSHLFHSAITAVYAGIHLLLNLWIYRDKLKQMIRKNFIFLFILIMWGIALIFEASGGRAGSFDGLDFIKVFWQLEAMIHALSKPFLLVVMSLLILMLGYVLKKRVFGQMEILQIFIILMCNEIFLIAFLWLLNAKTAYMSRIDASWGMWFYLIVIIVIAAAYVVKQIPLMSKVLPFVIPILIFASLYPDGKFLMSTRENADYQTCANLDYYVVDNIMEASKNGVDEITIYIPDHSDDLRFLAYSEGLGDIAANCLYAQGIIINKPVVHTIVDKSINDTFENQNKRKK